MGPLFYNQVVASHNDSFQTDSGGHSFVGSAPAAKEFDCVIIFDPQTMVRAIYSTRLAYSLMQLVSDVHDGEGGLFGAAEL